MEKSSVNKSSLGKFVTGTTIGVGLGMLFAPKSGKETRKILTNSIEKLISEAKELDKDNIKEIITKKAQEIELEIKELDKEKTLKIVKEKAKNIQTKADDLYKLAIEKGTPILEKTASDVKKNYNKTREIDIYYLFFFNYLK